MKKFWHFVCFVFTRYQYVHPYQSKNTPCFFCLFGVLGIFLSAKKINWMKHLENSKFELESIEKSNMHTCCFSCQILYHLPSYSKLRRTTNYTNRIYNELAYYPARMTWMLRPCESFPLMVGKLFYQLTDNNFRFFVLRCPRFYLLLLYVVYQILLARITWLKEASVKSIHRNLGDKAVHMEAAGLLVTVKSWETLRPMLLVCSFYVRIC